MADRNLFILSERRQEVDGHTNIIKDEANHRLTEKQAKLHQKTSKLAAQKAA